MEKLRYVLFLYLLLQTVWAADKKQHCTHQYFEERLMDPKHSMCIQKYLNQTAAEAELSKAIAEDDLETFMKNNCPKWTKAVECLDAYFQDVLTCLDVEYKLLYKVGKKILLSSISYICEHHGKKMIDFVRNGGVECIEENKESLQKCVADDFGGAIPTSATEIEKDIFTKVDLMKEVFTLDKCRLLQNATNCIINVIDTSCTNNYTHEFVQSYLKRTLKETPCWGLLGILSDANWESYLFSIMVPRHIPTVDHVCSNDTGVTGADVQAVALKNATECWNKVIDDKFLINDAQAAFQSRTLVSFLRKYCPKMQSLSECAGDYLDAFQPCVRAEGEDSITMESTKNILKKVVNFMCHRDGERILLFMKENGLECLEDEHQNIRTCVEATGVTEIFGNYDDFQLTDKFDPATFLQELWVPQNYRPEECRVIVSLEVCVYKTMRKCKERSPANLVSSLIRAVAREAPCWKISIEGSSNINKNNYLLSAVAFLSTLLMFRR